MKQQMLAGFDRYGKATRWAHFLAEADRVVPWAELTAVIELFHPQARPEGGCPAVPLERMLRICLLQQWFNLSDLAVEEALYDATATHGFVGIDLGREPAPDEITVCKLRHRLERHGLGKKILAAVKRYLHEHGIKVTTGMIVDATIISAPSSTKARSGKRDPEMYQTAKGNQWYFGMNAHLGIDSKAKLIHTILASAANVHDRDALPHMLHGNETRVWGDQAYRGQGDAIRTKAPRPRDFTNRTYRFHDRVVEDIRACNRTKSRVRARGEHPIGVIKRVFSCAKVRYHGLAKNLHRLEVTAALANLFMVRRQLLRLAG